MEQVEKDDKMTKHGYLPNCPENGQWWKNFMLFGE